MTTLNNDTSPPANTTSSPAQNPSDTQSTLATQRPDIPSPIRSMPTTTNANINMNQQPSSPDHISVNTAAKSQQDPNIQYQSRFHLETDHDISYDNSYHDPAPSNHASTTVAGQMNRLLYQMGTLASRLDTCERSNITMLTI